MSTAALDSRPTDLAPPIRPANSVSVACDSQAPPGWDEYVVRHPLASAYHRASAVAIGATAFGLRTSYLAARDGQGRIVGVLPLVEQSSFAFGRFLVSVPFLTYGGILSDDEQASLALEQAAARLARQRKADHVELRHSAPVKSSFAERLDKVSMVLPLPATEELLNKQLGAKLRSQVRRAEREQPEVVWGGEELVSEFYPVFARAMHELGTPVYSRKFFDVTCAALKGLLDILIIRVGGAVQAAAILVRHGSRVEVPWAAATPLAKKNAINMRMYWEMLSFAVRSGAAEFDFGRSTVDSGTYRFKAQWGAKPMQLHWHYWLPDGAPIPKLNQSNPKYARAAAAWRRLPLWCANLIGPHIVRNLP